MNMEKMQEDYFDNIKKSNEKCPPHEIVKLYINGTHTDYGCKKCKIKSLDLTVFGVNY